MYYLVTQTLTAFLSESFALLSATFTEKLVTIINGHCVTEPQRQSIIYNYLRAVYVQVDPGAYAGKIFIPV